MGSSGGRTWGARVAAAGVAVVCGWVGALPVPQPAGAAGQGRDMLPEGDWTEAQVAEAQDLIDRTEDALSTRFGLLLDEEAVKELESAGFAHFGLVAPGGWEHWVNLEWVEDDRILDPEHPEWLVTREAPDGRHEVWAAMYMLPTDYDMASIPEDVAWLPGWHHHPDEMCINEDGTFAAFVDAEGECAAGAPAPPAPMMHVWVRDTECGHRFPGVDATGMVCSEPGHEEAGQAEDHDGGEEVSPPSEAPPAPRVSGAPAFTG